MTERWSSIESAAESLEISERTAWRWLKSGKLTKIRNEEGDFFVLADNDNDPDGDFDGTGDNNYTSHTNYTSYTDDSIAIPINRGRSRVRGKSNKQRSNSFDPTAALRKELEAHKLELDLERLEDFRLQREERKAQIRREKLEQEKLRLEQERLKFDREQKIKLEQEAKERERVYREKKEKEIQETIRRVKYSIVLLQHPEFIPSHAFLELNLKLDEFFRRVDVMAYPVFELRQMAEGVCVEALRPYGEEIRRNVWERGQQLLQAYQEQILQEYQRAIGRGEGEVFIQAIQGLKR